MPIAVPSTLPRNTCSGYFKSKASWPWKIRPMACGKRSIVAIGTCKWTARPAGIGELNLLDHLAPFAGAVAPRRFVFSRSGFDEALTTRAAQDPSVTTRASEAKPIRDLAANELRKFNVSTSCFSGHSPEWFSMCRETRRPIGDRKLSLRLAQEFPIVTASRPCATKW